MTRHQSLNILQYNVQKSRDVVLASLFQDRWISEYHVLAIQEPWRNPFIATSYHPLKTHFHLTYFEDKETRVCFYINRHIDASTWNVSFITKDVILLEIIYPAQQHKLAIINVYNELGMNALPDLRRTVASLATDHEIIVLGDFNLHYPLWSSARRHTNQQIAAAQPLLTIIEDFEL